jgi:hypothetical protein
LLAEIVRRYAAWQAPSLWCGLMALAGLFALALMFILYAESYSSIRTFACSAAEPRHARPGWRQASPRLSVLGRVGAHDYVGLERFANAVTEPGVLVLRPAALDYSSVDDAVRGECVTPTALPHGRRGLRATL